MTIKILVRNLPTDKTNADYEVVALKKVPEGETFEDQEWGEVLSIYNNSDASSTHYRIRGVQNSYYRKAKDCNNVTFSDNDRVFAHLKAIEYEIPKEGVPERDAIRFAPDDSEIGGIVKLVGWTTHLASGKCSYRHGQETGKDERWVESVSVTMEGTRNYAWVKFTHDDKYYILDCDIQHGKMLFLGEIDQCRRDRLALKAIVGDVKPILPVIWVNDDGEEPVSDEINQLMGKAKLTRHSIVFGGNNDQLMADVMQKVGDDYTVGNVKRVIAFQHNADVYLELVDCVGISHWVKTTFDALEGGWSLRSDLSGHGRSLISLCVAFTLEEEVKKAEEEKARKTSPDTVIWSAGKKQKVERTGTYVTTIAVRMKQRPTLQNNHHFEDDVRKHMATVEQWIPGLVWEEVEEVRGNFDVVVNGSVISGTKEAREQLSRQMSGDIDTVLVGILSL